jgi:hypothetical protein
MKLPPKVLSCMVLKSAGFALKIPPSGYFCGGTV